MKIIVEIDLNNNECRLLSKKDLTKKDVADIILGYFQLSLEELTNTPLIKKTDFVLCRRFIGYFLTKYFNSHHNEIIRLLNYEGISNKTTNIVWFNNEKIKLRLFQNDVQYTRIYNNLVKIFEGFTLK